MSKFKYNNGFNDPGINSGALTVLGVIGVVVLVLFIQPWLSFWLAYFCGWIAKLVIGKYLVAGLALLKFDIPLDKIPLVAGVLGWVGSFFKSTINLNKNK